jgi:CRISPR-associated exonuclease Cas4
MVDEIVDSTPAGTEQIDFESEVQTALEAANDPETRVERDATTFHPSQLVRCERRAYCAKLGLDDTREILGVFRTGTLIHEFLEQQLGEQLTDEAIEFEREIEHEIRGSDLTLTGRADCVDFRSGVVYDFKTRNGWYNFDPPVQRHCDQLHLYMAALPRVDQARVVYLSKGTLEVRQWPEDSLFAFDEERYDTLIEKAERIRDVIKRQGIAASADEIPFEKCECYFCSQESLQFDGGDDDE